MTSLFNHPSRKIYEPPSLLNDLENLAAKVAVRIRQSLDLEDILVTSAREVQEVLKADRTVIYQFNRDRTGKILVEEVAKPWRSLIGEEIKDNCFEYHWHIPFTKGLALSTDDVQEYHSDPCYLELLKYLQVRANIVAPIMQDDYLWGLFVVHQCSDRRVWTQEEVRLLQQLGIQLGIAIQQAELYKQLKERNQELEVANERLGVVLSREKDLSDLKSNFLSLTAHEFRTPMTTIRSSAELLESFPCNPDEQSLLFQQIHNAVDYMVKMLDDIRFMSRRPEEQVNLNQKSINIVTFIEEICTGLRSSMLFQHRCDCRATNIPEQVLLDEKLTRQILENLLSNAMKYSSAKYPIIINISCPTEKGLSIEVCDQGMGIPEAEQSHVYESFYRAKNVVGMKGTGLGLAIVKRCVEMCQGTIEMESELNKGTTFRVYLPFIINNPAPSPG